MNFQNFQQVVSNKRYIVQSKFYETHIVSQIIMAFQVTLKNWPCMNKE